MGYMLAKDAISGKEGSLYAKIGDEVIQVAECKNISATITKNKAEFRSLGHRGSQHKATGWAGSGSMTVYYATTRWVKMLVDYAQTGVDTYFKLTLTNEDPTSGIGKQVVSLIDCNIDDVEIAKLDVDSEFLDQSISFTFSDVEVETEFDELEV